MMGTKMQQTLAEKMVSHQGDLVQWPIKLTIPHILALTEVLDVLD